MDIKTLVQLEELLGRSVPSAHRDALERVLVRFPVRISRHLMGLIQRSSAVATQFLPDPREMAPDQGESYCFTGLLSTGVPGVERIYPDRCVIMPTPFCPAYCRFCFRKYYEHREERGGSAKSFDDLERAIVYVARQTELREVLITGGEPVLSPSRLSFLLRGLRSIKHIGPIRIGCRCLVSCPELIDQQLVELLAAYQDLRNGQPIEIASHINHVDELSEPTIDALIALKRSGIHVYNQAVLLRGVNDHPSVMRELLWQLRQFGIETYTIYFGEPVLGAEHQRVSMREAIALKKELRRRASGRSNPHLIIATRIGKVELGIDSNEIEREPDGRHVWIHTPYTVEEFKRLDPQFQLPGGTRVNRFGELEVRYLDGPPPDNEQ